MKRITNAFRIFSALAAASLLSLSAPASARDFRLGLVTPPTQSWSVAASNFATELKEESGGKHSLTVFPSAQLGNEAQMVQQLQTGALDMAFLTMAEISNRIPNFGAWYAPYLVSDIQQAGALLRTPEAAKMLESLPRGAGLVGIGYGLAGMRQIMSRQDIDNADGLKGKKIRITPFEPIRDFYNALGAASTPLPVSAVFDALANGQIDAVDMDLEVMYELKLFQNVNTILLSNHMMFPMVGVVSARVWQTLTPEDRELITRLMSKHLEQIIDGNIAKEAEFEKLIRGTGKSVKAVDAEFFRTAIDRWEAIWVAKAPGLTELRQAAEALRKAN